MSEGRWIVVVPIQHHVGPCRVPDRDDVDKGSIWECECGIQWKLTKFWSDDGTPSYRLPFFGKKRVK